MISRFIILLGGAALALGLFCHCADEGEAPTENGGTPTVGKDPGAPDSVIIDLATAVVYDDDSLIVAVLVVTDELLAAGTIPIKWSGDDWAYDGAYFVSDRWTPGGDITPIDFLFVTETLVEDSSKVSLNFQSFGTNYLPAGRDTVAAIHFHKKPDAVAPLESPIMEFTTFPPGNELLFVTQAPTPVGFNPVGVVTGP